MLFISVCMLLFFVSTYVRRITHLFLKLGKSDVGRYVPTFVDILDLHMPRGSHSRENKSTHHYLKKESIGHVDLHTVKNFLTASLSEESGLGTFLESHVPRYTASSLVFPPFSTIALT
jgi:hypothetical protein